jgi:hypothetical protein
MDSGPSYHKIVCLNALTHIGILEHSNHYVDEADYQEEGAEKINLAPPFLMIGLPSDRIFYSEKELTFEKV